MIRTLPQQGHGGTRLLAYIGIGVLLSILAAGCGSDNTASTGGTSTLKASEFAYVVNQDDNTVSQFAVASNGRLTPLTPATVTVPANALDVIVHPNKQFAYVTEVNLQTGAASASQFQIQADGTLKPLTPATVALGTLVLPGNALGGNPTQFLQPVPLPIDPAGHFLYALTANGVLHIPINTDGTLGAPATALQLAGGQAFAFDPQGRFAYVGTGTQAAGALIATYKVNADGTFTQVAAPGLKIPTEQNVLGLAADPTGRFLYSGGYATDQNGDTSALTLHQFKVGADGTLTLVNTINANPTSVEQGTNLTNISSAQVAQFPLAFGLLQFNLTFDPAGKFAYLTTLGAKVLQYEVNTDGTLTALSPANVLAGSAPRAVTVDPTDTFAYTANQDTTVSLFQVGANGALTSLSPPTQTIGHRPVSITLFQPAAKAAAARVVLGRSR